MRQRRCQDQENQRAHGLVRFSQTPEDHRVGSLFGMGYRELHTTFRSMQTMTTSVTCAFST